MKFPDTGSYSVRVTNRKDEPIGYSEGHRGDCVSPRPFVLAPGGHRTGDSLTLDTDTGFVVLTRDETSTFMIRYREFTFNLNDVEIEVIEKSCDPDTM